MMKKGLKGKFIVFEGIDGAGKSTQAELLYQFFKKEKIPAILTKEPTDGRIGRLIDRFLKNKEKINDYALQLLFTADRAEHLEKTVLPHLKKGINVICDRYFFSTIAYGLLKINDFLWLYNLNKNFPLPDITFFLDLPVKEALRRIQEKRKVFSLFEKENRLKRIKRNYLLLKKKFPGIITIDGQLPILDVFEIIKGVLKKEYIKKGRKDNLKQ